MFLELLHRVLIYSYIFQNSFAQNAKQWLNHQNGTRVLEITILNLMQLNLKFTGMRFLSSPLSGAILEISPESKLLVRAFLRREIN